MGRKKHANYLKGVDNEKYEMFSKPYSESTFQEVFVAPVAHLLKSLKDRVTMIMELFVKK